MLGNLKQVLLQHKRFLALIIFIVFLPSIILAVLGIRAIHNERYKLRQQNREQQVELVETFQDEVLSLIERNSSSLREVSTSRAFVELDYPAIHDLISRRSREQSLLGHAVIWNRSESPWLPGLQEYPPAARPWIVPSEWKKWQPELAKGEEAEFRRRSYSGAVFLYNQILRRAQDSHVRAWIQSRVARCEVKQEKFKQALITYRSILAEYHGLLTESGRPLGLVTCLQILDALRSDNDYAAFFQESLEIYRQLEQNVWSLDGDQVELYANMLKNLIDEVAAENSLNSAPSDYAASVENIRDAIETKVDIWRMAAAVKINILPRIKDRLEVSKSGSLQIHRDSFEMDGNEVLALILPVDRNNTGRYEDFLGSLIQNRDMVNAIDPEVTEKRLPGITIILRSTLTGKIIYGDVIYEGDSPVFADFFPENFPPWSVEAYEDENVEAEFYLYKNIFFWTILALLMILFLGSGLIIRTIVQEANLLNLKSEFIASVSHEFKTQLTAMGAILERLMGGEVKDPHKAQEYYRILSHDAERLKRLVKNVLDFTKIEEGKRKYKMASLDIVQLVRREVDSFEKENKMA